MLNLDNSQKLVMGIMGTIATIAFGTAVALHCKDKKVAEAKHQARLERAKIYVDMVHTVLVMSHPHWWTTKPSDRVALIDTDIREYMEAITESLTKSSTERLEKEIGEYVDLKSLQKKPKTE